MGYMKNILELQTQIERANGDLNAEACFRCELARELAEAGDFEAARRAMGQFWQTVGIPPKLDGLNQGAGAELLLRAGSLTGWIGSTQQLAEAQDLAKDLLSAAMTILDRHEDIEKQAEARVEIAYCYWREGSFDESRILLEEALSLLGKTGSRQKARALKNMAIVASSRGDLPEALSLLTEAEPLYDDTLSHALRGGFHNQMALVLRNIWEDGAHPDYLDRALIHLTAASVHFEQAGSQRYQAVVENNLGELYIELKRFTEAHEHLERARRLATLLKDRFHLALMDDTLANLHLAANHPSEAAEVAKHALAQLDPGGERAMIVRVQTTYGKAMARLAHFEQAQEVLLEAREIAELIDDHDGRANVNLTMIEELGDYLHPTELVSLYNQANVAHGQSIERATLRRLRRCSTRVLAAISVELGFDADSYDTPLEEKMKRFEAALVKSALRSAHGQITPAARLLGMSHQLLDYSLKHKHRELLGKRVPARRRFRSLVKRT